MNPLTPRYPVDRYLVERSSKIEMVNIDDDIWNAEPALRPEDEIILRKLHDMLQSTADDLKLLSGELSKYHEPGVQVRSLPMPLDEDFNEKVHIEEIVNAKFHGHKIVDENSPQNMPTSSQKKVIKELLKTITTDTPKPKTKVVSTGIQVNNVPMPKKITKTRNLAVSRTKTFEIHENVNKNTNITKDNEREINKNHTPAVAYSEISFKYVEPTLKESIPKNLQVQNMPSINIRSELREQKVLNLNIEPEVIDKGENLVSNNNISVISIQHEPTDVHIIVPKTNHNQVQFCNVPTVRDSKKPTRKVSKMSSCESSESISNNFTNLGIKICHQTKPQKVTEKKFRPPKQSFENVKCKKNMSGKRENTNHSSLDEWKKKLNAVYGRPNSSRLPKSIKSGKKVKKYETNHSSPKCSQQTKNTNTLNNAHYIPYSKLTLGGVRVSDIEKELSDIPNRNDIPLSPILDKILSRENSFRNDSSQDHTEGSPKILTTSDENLLREVLDIEHKVNKTLSKNIDEDITLKKDKHDLHDFENQDSYADDFEEEKTDNSYDNDIKNQSSDSSEHKGKSSDNDGNKCVQSETEQLIGKNVTNSKKAINLSFKNKVDIFEFVHSVDTQETGTQSYTNKKISLKETQTSPRNDSNNVQPIHNNLWPSIDPKGEVQKLFDLEKDFIKKLIIDEYGDLLTKNLNKPSTSKDYHICDEKNVVSSQKNTQTSPGHVKSSMTSPTRTKTRTTSPFAMSITVDKQTSPIIIEELNINVEDGDDLGISINLSSPRFSLRLPQSSREVLSNLESQVQSKKINQPLLNKCEKNSTSLSKIVREPPVNSSSSVDGDYSSSDISSLGEVKFKLKRKLRKFQVPSISELSSSSISKSSSDITDPIIPLRSEGEISLGQVNRKHHTKIKSEGEMSLGRLH